MEKQKIDVDKLRELHSNGKYDLEISLELGCTRSAISYWRKKLNLNSNSKNKHIYIDSQTEQVLIGCVLGDGSILLGGKKRQPLFQCAHGPKQFEYNKWKYNLLSSLNIKLKEYIRKTANKKSGKIYEFNLLSTGANSELFKLRNLLYPNGVKVITSELLKNYSELSLAIHYMDDGHTAGNTYGIATCGFDRKSVEVFSRFLLEKFNIENTISKDNRIRIKRNSTEKMDRIIRPYVEQIQCMRYKLIK